MEYELLYQLSRVDEDIAKYEKKLKLCEKLKKLELLKTEYSEIKLEYDNATKECKKNTATVNDLTEKLESMTANLEQSEQNLYTAKNEKTIESFQKSIENQKKDIKDNESTVYSLINVIQDLEVQKKQLIKAAGKIKNDFDDLKIDYTAEKKSLEEALLTLTTERDTFKKQINQDLIKKYEAIKKAKGYGVSCVNGDICDGCGLSVPRVIINKALLDKKLVKCPNCDRFIYVKQG